MQICGFPKPTFELDRIVELSKMIHSIATILLLLGAFFQTTPRLSDVRRIYVEKMNNNLDEYLRAEISHKFHGGVTIVLNRSEADAVLTGVNLGAQRTETATVNLVDQQHRVVLWSGTANDRNAKFLNLKHSGQDKVAQHLVDQLKMQR